MASEDEEYKLLEATGGCTADSVKPGQRYLGPVLNKVLDSSNRKRKVPNSVAVFRKGYATAFRQVYKGEGEEPGISESAETTVGDELMSEGPTNMPLSLVSDFILPDSDSEGEYNNQKVGIESDAQQQLSQSYTITERSEVTHSDENMSVGSAYSIVEMSESIIKDDSQTETAPNDPEINSLGLGTTAYRPVDRKRRGHRPGTDKINKNLVSVSFPSAMSNKNELLQALTTSDFDELAMSSSEFSGDAMGQKLYRMLRGARDQHTVVESKLRTCIQESQEEIESLKEELTSMRTHHTNVIGEYKKAMEILKQASLQPQLSAKDVERMERDDKRERQKEIDKAVEDATTTLAKSHKTDMIALKLHTRTLQLKSEQLQEQSVTVTQQHNQEVEILQKEINEERNAGRQSSESLERVNSSLAKCERELMQLKEKLKRLQECNLALTTDNELMTRRESEQRSELITTLESELIIVKTQLEELQVKTISKIEHDATVSQLEVEIEKQNGIKITLNERIRQLQECIEFQGREAKLASSPQPPTSLKELEDKNKLISSLEERISTLESTMESESVRLNRVLELVKHTYDATSGGFVSVLTAKFTEPRSLPQPVGTCDSECRLLMSVVDNAASIFSAYQDLRVKYEQELTRNSLPVVDLPNATSEENEQIRKVICKEASLQIEKQIMKRIKKELRETVWDRMENWLENWTKRWNARKAVLLQERTVYLERASHIIRKNSLAIINTSKTLKPISAAVIQRQAHSPKSSPQPQTSSKLSSHPYNYMTDTTWGGGGVGHGTASAAHNLIFPVASNNNVPAVVPPRIADASFSTGWDNLVVKRPLTREAQVGAPIQQQRRPLTPSFDRSLLSSCHPTQESVLGLVGQIPLKKIEKQPKKGIAGHHWPSSWPTSNPVTVNEEVAVRIDAADITSLQLDPDAILCGLSSRPLIGVHQPTFRST